MTCVLVHVQRWHQALEENGGVCDGVMMSRRLACGPLVTMHARKQEKRKNSTQIDDEGI